MIKIICVGKIKEKYVENAINDYLKRISKFSKINVIQLPDYSYDEKKTKYEEGKNILSKVNNEDFVVVLDINGNTLNSVEFSNFILKNVSKQLVFIIGGSYGLSNDVLKRANYVLSFSKLTFPHQLFRVMLLEQIYRSFKIINNESYHK